ncbi:DUF6493 family protein [Streptomyces sp. NBC_00876]|uniref:DUF7824 domain-containing protein n=1 Tax=Streptomyces sp. NBC_00876 TaxID=2975853 RepID=UPI0038707C8B|nr:DUF6493 family protein [Streptomyces sp. NBC_00876]
MNELLAAVREGRLDDVPALLAPLDRAERRLALVELKALRKEARTWAWGERTRVRKAVLVAGAGCHTGAAGCATWIGAREMRDWVHAPQSWLLRVLADRDPVWLADLARRLAARAVESEAEFRFVRELARRANCALPTSDGMVRGWVERVSSARWQSGPRQPLAGLLRAEPHLDVLAPHLLDMPELPPAVTWVDTRHVADNWPTALTTLAAEGLLDRDALLDSCVTRLLRGGRTADLRFCLLVLHGLEPTAQEESARIADWIAMAADGPSTVAGYAQDVLTRLDGRGEISPQQLADVSGPVLFRTEKKLVRSQLVLLGKVLRRDPSAAGELLPVVAEAFGHPDIGIQERALKLVARHLAAAGPDVREELAGMTSQLGPVHRSAAQAVFGELPADGPAVDAHEEILPPAPAPRRLAPASTDPPGLVEEVVALLRSGPGEVTDFERALDGLVRCAHTGRSALADALRPAIAGQWWAAEAGRQDDIDRRFTRNPAGLHVVTASLLGQVSPRTIHDGQARWTATGTCVHAALDGVMYARLWEAAAEMRSGRLPFLLATPTWHTGAIDPLELVERLRGYRDLDVAPGPADFAQALLRVRRTGGHEAAAQAERLGTAQGDRLAAWIRADEPVAPVLHRHVEYEAPAATGWMPRPATGVRRILLDTKERLVIQREFPRAFRWLGRPHTPGQQQCHHWGAGSAQWIATLPEDGETLAAWLLPSLASCVEDQRAGSWSLPALVETGGPAGRAIHLSLAYGLGARYPQDRLSAVDAQLVLAAQGRLDAELLAGELGVLIDRDLVKPSRLADSARTAAATGAYRTVLSVLAPLLPSLLAREKAPRGLSDLLAVAAECTERCGPPKTGPIAGLAATAARGGATELVRQAARLEAAIGQTER